MNKASKISTGAMKAAYGTLEALLMVKCHDMVADAAAQYNVTWGRTTPIVVSVFDDAHYTILTLECSHRFGMDVIGDPGNITAFRYACSAAINPLEHMVGESLFPGDNNTSIVMGLGQLIFNGQMPDMFMSNGYLVMKSGDNKLFLVLDPETGILRDVMIRNSTISGSYCYSDQQAEWAFDLAEDLLNNPLNIPWMGSIPSLAMGLNVFGPGASFPGLGSLSSFFTSVGVSGPAADALAGLTRFARNPLTAALIGVGITTFVVGNYLCDKYGWLPPEQARQILGNAFPLSFGLINQFLYDKESPKLAEIGNACWDAGYYLMGKTKKQIEVEYHTGRLKDLEKIQNSPSPKKKPDDFKVQAALLGQALGVALANNDIIRASTIIVVGGLWALGESIVETLQQKEKGNQTNNTTSG